MVTGDHPITAKAIARCVGIISEGTVHMHCYTLYIVVHKLLCTILMYT